MKLVSLFKQLESAILEVMDNKKCPCSIKNNVFSLDKKNNNLSQQQQRITTQLQRLNVLYFIATFLQGIFSFTNNG